MNNGLCISTEVNWGATDAVHGQPISKLQPPYVRLNHRVIWRNVEPQRGVYDFSTCRPPWGATDLHGEIDFLLHLNIKPLVIVRGIPAWMRADGRTCAPLPRTQPIETLEMTAELGRRVALEFGGDIEYEWQNEPDTRVSDVKADEVFGAWIDDQNAHDSGYWYGSTYAAFRKGVRSAKSNAKVWTGGLGATHSVPTVDFAIGILNATGGLIDVFALHHHAECGTGEKSPFAPTQKSGDWFWGGIGDQFNTFKTIFEERNLGVPISYNECSLKCVFPNWQMCAAGDQFEAKKALYLSKLWAELNRQAHSLFWYSLEPAGWGASEMTNDKGEPYPVFEMARQINSLVRASELEVTG